MKQGLHPDYQAATITCNGCGNNVQTRATVAHIEVEICAQCHPFYTGKQKLVDVAGRVDRFRARQQQAAADASKTKKTKSSEAAATAESDKKSLSDLKDLQKAEDSEQSEQ